MYNMLDVVMRTYDKLMNHAVHVCLGFALANLFLSICFPSRSSQYLVHPNIIVVAARATIITTSASVIIIILDWLKQLPSSSHPMHVSHNILCQTSKCLRLSGDCSTDRRDNFRFLRSDRRGPCSFRLRNILWGAWNRHTCQHCERVCKEAFIVATFWVVCSCCDKMLHAMPVVSSIITISESHSQTVNSTRKKCMRTFSVL